MASLDSFGFVKGDSGNLPYVDVLMTMEYFNKEYISTEFPSAAVDPDPKSVADQKPGTLPSDVELDNASKDLLLRLLEFQPRRRLRSFRSLETIAFFKGFNFKDIRDKKIKPNDLLKLYFCNGPKNFKENFEKF